MGLKLLEKPELRLLSEGTKTKEFEGFVPDIYKDTIGKRTIGYGFNIDEPFISKLLPSDVSSGKRPITRQESDSVFNILYSKAKKDAIDYFGIDKFNKLPSEIQETIIDMSYNLGANRLSGFKKFREALREGNTQKAAEELKNSKWYKQVGNRSKYHYETIKKAPKLDLSFLNPFMPREAFAEELPSLITPKEEIIPEFRAGKKRFLRSLTDAEKAQALIDVVLKERGEEVPRGLKLLRAIESPEAQTISQTILAPEYTVLQGIRGAIDKTGGYNLIDRIKRGVLESENVKRFYEYIPRTEKLPKWAKITAGIGEDIVALGTMGLGRAALRKGLLTRNINRKIETAAEEFVNENLSKLKAMPAGYKAEEAIKTQLKTDFKNRLLQRVTAPEVEGAVAESTIGKFAGEVKPSILQGYIEKQSFLKLVGDELKALSKKGQALIPKFKVGDVVKLKRGSFEQGLQNAIVKAIEGDKAMLEVAGKSIPVALSKLTYGEKPTLTGEGKVYYTGGKETITDFVQKKTIGTGEEKLGTHFTTSEDYATTFAGKEGKITKVNLDIKKPYNITEENELLIEAPYSHTSFIKGLKEKGYDAIVLKGQERAFGKGTHDQVFVLDPSIIKLSQPTGKKLPTAEVKPEFKLEAPEEKPKPSKIEKGIKDYLKGEPGSLYQIIKSEGGIAPYKKGMPGALREEFRENVPLTLRNKSGKTLDIMADTLKTQYPYLDIESESDLLEALAQEKIAPKIEYADEEIEQEIITTPTLIYEGPLFKAILKTGAEWRTLSGKMTTTKALDKIKKTLGEGRYKVTGGEKPDEIIIEEVEPIKPEVFLTKSAEKIRKGAISKLPEELRSERLKVIAEQLTKLAEVAPHLITPKQIAYIHVLKQKNLLSEHQFARLKKIYTGKKTLAVTTPTGKLKKAPITKEEAGRFIEPLEKGFVPRKPVITGQPPVIPITKALVPSEWSQPFNDLTDFQASPVSGLDPIRAAELVDGKPWGVVRKTVVEPAREAERKWKNELKHTLDDLTKVSKGMGSKSKESELTFKFVEKTLAPDEERLITQDIRNTAEYMSKVYDNLLERVNNARRILGKVPIQKRQDYITHTWELSLLDEFYQGLSNVPDDVINVPSFAKTNSPFFKFALARLGGKEFEVDAIKAFETYISRAYPVIYNTEVLKSARPLVNRLPSNAYKYFTQYLDETMGLRPAQADRLVPKSLLRGITWLRVRMGKGAILGNVASVFNQLFTLPNITSMVNPKFIASATLKMGNDNWRAFTEKYSKVLQGRIYEIDFDPTILSKVDNALGFLLHITDKEMVRIAWGAGFEQA
jgi:lysozyme